MNILAIDPGKLGGLALLTRAGVVAITMPATPQLVVAVLDECCRKCRSDSETLIAILEHVTGCQDEFRPGARMFSFGFGYGVLHGCLLQAGVGPEIVAPARWQRTLGFHRADGEGDCAWKNRLKAAAAALFPAQRVTLRTADALLILAFRAGWTAAHGPGPFRFPCS